MAGDAQRLPDDDFGQYQDGNCARENDAEIGDHVMCISLEAASVLE